MVFFNYSTMQMAAKIVYYGPGLCGKTTNLQYIYNHTAAGSRGEMVSLETETDRTLFFDLLPLDVGSIGGFHTRIQLYTVPGQVFYNTTRKLVLKGVDGIVFVADSQRPMLQANVDSFNNLEDNLAEMGLTVDSLPLILQYNKRDLSDISPVEELNTSLNRNGWSYFEASAINGQGVFETLKGISKLTLLSLKRRLAKELRPAGRPPVPPPREAPAASGGPGEPPPRARPEPVAPAAAEPPRAAAAAEPAIPRPSRPRRQADVLAELERIRRQALQEAPAAPTAAGSVNGRNEIHRDVELTLERADFERARRFCLNLQVQDDEDRIVDAIHNLEVEIEEGATLQEILLRLNIAVHARK